MPTCPLPLDMPNCFSVPRLKGRIYVENGPASRVDVAFSNPNAQDVTLSFYFTDSNGVNSLSITTTIPANGQIARFAGEEPFSAPSGFQGTPHLRSVPTGGRDRRSRFHQRVWLVPDATSSGCGNWRDAVGHEDRAIRGEWPDARRNFGCLDGVGSGKSDGACRLR